MWYADLQLIFPLTSLLSGLLEEIWLVGRSFLLYLEPSYFVIQIVSMAYTFKLIPAMYTIMFLVINI